MSMKLSNVNFKGTITIQYKQGHEYLGKKSIETTLEQDTYIQEVAERQTEIGHRNPFCMYPKNAKNMINAISNVTKKTFLGGEIFDPTFIKNGSKFIYTDSDVRNHESVIIKYDPVSLSTYKKECKDSIKKITAKLKAYNENLDDKNIDPGKLKDSLIGVEAKLDNFEKIKNQ